jgi:hypothetical protein
MPRVTDDEPELHRPAGTQCKVVGCEWERLTEDDRRAELIEDLARHLVREHPPLVVAELLVSSWLEHGLIVQPTLRPVVAATMLPVRKPAAPRHLARTPLFVAPPTPRMLPPGQRRGDRLPVPPMTAPDGAALYRPATPPVRARSASAPGDGPTAGSAILAFLRAHPGVHRAKALALEVERACGPRSPAATGLALSALCGRRVVERVAKGMYRATRV